MSDTHIDLVLEGGGVRGIGIAGAYRSLEKAGYTFHRIAGTSAGSLMAAMIAAGYTSDELTAVLDTIDYRKFADQGVIDQFGIAGRSLSLLFEKGVYEGRYIRELMLELLEKKGIRTFGDLKLTQPESDDIKDAYKLVIIVTDVTRAKLVRLPWDYHEYGLDPDTQLVADAVRASTAIPFYYEPARLGKSFMIDGSLSANFPIWLFENESHHHLSRPTIGIKSSAKETSPKLEHLEPITGAYSYAFAVLGMVVSGQDQIHLNNPCTVARTIFIDSEDISGTNFAITKEQRHLLYQNGVAAADKFLGKWDYQKFLGLCTH